MFIKWKNKSPVTFCLFAELLFLVVTTVGSLLFLLLGVFAFPETLEENSYLLLLGQEFFGLLTVLLLLKKIHRLPLLLQKGSGFWRGLWVGGYLTVTLTFSWLGLVYSCREEGRSFPMGRVLLFAVAVFSVGLAEEGLFRVVIARTLLEKFGTTQKGIWKAVILSNVFFAAAHLTNAVGAELSGVLVQCVAVFFLGMLFTAIYFRTGNLWVVAFFHAYQDFLGLFSSGVEGSESFSDTISGYETANLLPCVIYLLVVLFLLRKKKLPEVEKNFEEGQKLIYRREKKEISAVDSVEQTEEMREAKRTASSVSEQTEETVEVSTEQPPLQPSALTEPKEE